MCILTFRFTFSHTGFLISVSKWEYSSLSYNIVSSFQINSRMIPTRTKAPDTLSPTVTGSAGPGGQPN